MMNLKPAIRYQVRDYVVSSLIFAVVNLLIVVAMVAGLLYFQIKTGTDSISYNGYTLSCTIFCLSTASLCPGRSPGCVLSWECAGARPSSASSRP